VPDRISGTPNRISGTPDRISGIPNHISGTPDRISGIPNCIAGLLNRISGRPSRISGDLNRVFRVTAADSPDFPIILHPTNTMTKDQINQVNMFQTTDLILGTPANTAIYSGLPAFVRGCASLTGSVNLLSALAQAQGSPLTGITLDKDSLKLSLIARLMSVGGAAGVYAYEKGNQTLAAKFEVVESTLKGLRDALLDETAQGIHDQAAALVTSDPVKTADVGLTPAVLTDLQSAITAYGSTLGTPRAAIANRVAVTEAIAAEIERALANLKNVLDRLIVQFTADHPAFTTAYATARKIVNAGNSHATPDPVPPIA